jgi:hypothetical protein
MDLQRAVLKLFPEAVPHEDFLIVTNPETNSPELTVWNLDAPQPSEEELRLTWDGIKDEPQPKSELEILQEKQELIFKALDDLILGGGF